MAIKSIHIKGYKSLKDITISNPARVNYLVGKNGCGKSSILEALLILSKSIQGRPGEAINVPGLTKYALTSNLHMYITFSNDKGFRLDIPQSVEIIVGSGNFGVAGDVITLWNGNSTADYAHDDVKTNTIRRLTQFTIATQYVSPFVQKEDSADYVILPGHMSLDFNNLDSITEEELLKFLNQNYPLDANETVSDVSSSLRSDKAIQFTVTDKNTKERIKKVALSQLSAGLRSITRFYFGLDSAIKYRPKGSGGLNIICIEEPENGFHPETQKRIPEILNTFAAANPDLIFMVSTHSPFIISAAGQFTDHKTYLLDKSNLVNLALDPVPANEGYGGERCANVVAEMLGMGFADMGTMPKTHENLTICYCEGAAKKDSELYRKIFPDQPVIFISCGGLEQARQAYNLARKSAPYILGANTKVMCLVDRSNSGNNVRVGPNSEDILAKTGGRKIIFTDEERTKFISSDHQGGLRMLRRKEIENYIFDPSVVSQLEPADFKQVNAMPPTIDFVGGEVKDRVNAPFEIRLKLADLIFQHRDGATKDVYIKLKETLWS